MFKCVHTTIISSVSGNEDYQMLLSSLSKFEALRQKAMTDLDRLYDLRQDAQANPEEFVRKLQTDPKVWFWLHASSYGLLTRT